MRFKLQCELEKKSIQMDYSRLIVSFLKKSLENYNKDVYEYFYGTPKEKNMTFSCYFPIEKFVENEIVLRENIFNIYISVEDMLEAMHFYNAFIGSRGKRFSVGNANNFKLTKIMKVNEQEITKDVAVFKTLSPILIGDHKRETNKTWYYLLDDEKGLEVLKKNLIHTLSPRYAKEKIEKLEVIPLDINKNVVSFYGMKLECSRGMFAVKGDKEILNHIYKAGFGSKKSIGFGCLDIME